MKGAPDLEAAPYNAKCRFCGAPPGEPCRTRRYDEYLEYGVGEVHEQPHAQRSVLNAAPIEQKVLP